MNTCALPYQKKTIWLNKYTFFAHIDREFLGTMVAEEEASEGFTLKTRKVN